MITSDKFKDNLDEIMEFVKNSIQQAKQFAGDHVPPLIENLITYYTSFHILLFTVGIILLFLSYKGIMKCMVRCSYLYHNYRDEKEIEGFDLEDFPYPAILTFAIIFGVVGAGLFIHNLINAIKIVVAPRLYLLEYASDIISSGGC